MDSGSDVSDANGAVVGGAVSVPAGDEFSCADGESVARVGVANFEDGTGDGLGFGDEKFEAAIHGLHDGEQRDGAVLDGHFDGKTAADFAVVDLEGADFGFSLRDGDMAGTVMAHEDDVIVEVHGVVLGEGTTDAEGVHDFHGLGIFNFEFAGDGHAAGGEEGVAEDDGADGVFVGGIADAHVVVGKGAELVFVDEAVEGNGGARGAGEFFRGAVGLHIEGVAEVGDLVGDLAVGDFAAEGGEFVHLDDFHMAAEVSALLGKIGVDVEHAGVVMAHDAKAIVFHDVRDFRGTNPVGNFIPRNRIILQHAGYLVEGDFGAVENIGDFRNRTGGTVGEPLARHLGAVAKGVEGGVIDGRAGLEIEDDHRHFGAADDGEHGAGEGVGGDVEEEEVYILFTKRVAGVEGFFRRVDEPEFVDGDAAGDAGDFFRDPRDVAFEPFFESGELRPVSVQSNSEKAELERTHKSGSVKKVLKLNDMGWGARGEYAKWVAPRKTGIANRGATRSRRA